MDVQNINAGRPPNLPAPTDGPKKTQVQPDAAGDTPTATTPARQKPPTEQLSESQRDVAIKQFKTNIESLASVNLKFSIDKDTERTVVKVVDKETGKTIRQIPSEEILALDKAITHFQGMLLHDKA
ncbi:MAG: flagellar protein FlaG [Sulfuricellaceae bacterium]